MAFIFNIIEFLLLICTCSLVPDSLNKLCKLGNATNTAIKAALQSISMLPFSTKRPKLFNKF